LSKIESTLNLLNNKSQGADLTLASKLPNNPLKDIVKPNLNKNLAQVIAVYDGKTGALDADYTYGLERLAVHDEDTTTGKVQDPLYYLYDGMGRVSEVTNPAGHVSDKYRFDPFGVEQPGGKMSPNAYKVLQNPFGYNGEMYDAEAGLSYMRNRYYEPETGRFLTRDLLPGLNSSPLSLNQYAYVENNPLKYLDPLGLEKQKASFNDYFMSGLEVFEGALETLAGTALMGTGVGSIFGAALIANGANHVISGAQISTLKPVGKWASEARTTS
jgi:RHS repeat-associated protein